MPFNTTEELIADIRAGKMVILVDDEERENEGDLMIAASCTRPEDINFMARYGRGLICLTLTSRRCRQLRLPLMVNETHAKHLTNFTVSIEAAQGVTTGISAADRARTILAAVAPDAGPSDLVQPGHIFPIMAQDGGVLTRAGHTEAGCDLARIAGFEPASVIVEILNEDGTMARRPELEQFARQHRLKIGTIADLIRYRLGNETTIQRVAESRVDTEFGLFQIHLYRDAINGQGHFALVRGRVEEAGETLVRVHMQDSLFDIAAISRPDGALPLRAAMRYIAEAGSGVLVILRRAEDTDEMMRRIQDYQLMEQGVYFPKPQAGSELRTYGLGAQILRDLGVRRMRILGSPKRLLALSGFGLEVVGYTEEESAMQKNAIASR